MADKNSSLPDPHDAERKNLSPLFGSHCASVTYALKAYVRGSYLVRLDAYMDDPVRKTWTVQKTSTITEPANGPFFFGSGERTRTQVQKLKTRGTFNDALAELQKFEKNCQSRNNEYTPQTPTAEDMGFKHFRAFAEREGYVFDLGGDGLARPHRDVLPASPAGFAQGAIERADRHLARPENEFDNNGPASKAPQTHFLFDQFTRAAHVHSMDDKLAELRTLDILDRFANHIRSAHDSLQTYCGKYSELGHGGLIDDALDALQMADIALRQLKAYGIDGADFDGFVLQCKATCHILHAEGLYDLMSRGQGDFAQNEALFRKRTEWAAELFAQIDPSPHARERLQDMIVQTPKPAVPDAIGAFLSQYDAQKAARLASGQAQSPRQKPPFSG